MRSEPFSLLMPVWARDSPEFFRAAFLSSVNHQTRRPDEVVIVRDGPIGVDLEAELDRVIARSPVPVMRVLLDENVGLAQALTIGLQHATHDVIARMDADDIALPERFALQLPVLESGYDLVGTGMYEFTGDGRILGRRIPPVGGARIRAAARLRDPFNHPTVVYRRSAVARVGGYRDLALMEDYWLFARMLQHGARAANLADALVLYRIDDGAYARRGGWTLFRSELRLQRELHDEGFTTDAEYVRNVLVRGGYRFVPTWIRRPAYRLAFVSSPHAAAQAMLASFNVVVPGLGDDTIEEAAAA